MAEFLIDANLPARVPIWNNSNFIHVRQINDEWPDEEIWKYARENSLTIITKDSDFTDKFYLKGPPPKVVHIRTGNLSFPDFKAFISRTWPDILKMLERSNLVNVYIDRIEAIL